MTQRGSATRASGDRLGQIFVAHCPGEMRIAPKVPGSSSVPAISAHQLGVLNRPEHADGVGNELGAGDGVRLGRESQLPL